jgi:hypothetical protein
MTLFRWTAWLTVIAIFAACSEATTPKHSLTRIADCTGPTRSLDPTIAASLPQRTWVLTPDDRWAALARTVPGGFAGVLYIDSKPVLMLTDPSQAGAAKEALVAEFPSFDIRGAEVRKVRWDFAQLADWYDYLGIHGPVWQTPGTMSADKNEAINRIHYGVLDSASRAGLIASLAGMNLPCDLIVIEITGRVGVIEGSR